MNEHESSLFLSLRSPVLVNNERFSPFQILLIASSERGENKKPRNLLFCSA